MTQYPGNQGKVTPMSTAAPTLDALTALDRARADAVAYMDDAPLPVTPEALLAELEILGKMAKAQEAIHGRISRLCVRGQDPTHFDPRVTQDRMADALGVSGPRINVILKRARQARAKAAGGTRRPKAASTGD